MTIAAKPQSTGVTARETALHTLHQELGATFTTFSGWSMPLRYGSELAEHRAVRDAAGIFDLSHMGRIEVHGPEAGSALDYALVSRPSAMGIGRARYSMLCNDSGGIVDDLVVYRLAAERYLLVVNAGNASTVLGALRERAADYRASMWDLSTNWSLIAVQGPTSATIMRATSDLDTEALKYYSIAPGRINKREVLVARTGYTGEDGFEIFCPTADVAELWYALTAAGAPFGLVLAGLACRDTLRLEAGMPLYGHELSTRITPFEAGLERVIAFDKPGTFIGEHSLATRRDKTPHTQLVGLVSTGRRCPRPGQTVLDSHGQQAAGVITSGAHSPTLDRPIAMAYVATSYTSPGTRLAVDIRGRHDHVDVAPMPFYRRTRS